MGKNPAFQFYPADWSRDLEEHPLEIEGAWIRICCKLWFSETPGKMSRPLNRWTKILNIHHNTCLRIFKYLSSNSTGNSIGNIEVKDGLYTIVNRRMVRDWEILEMRRKCGRLGGNPNFEKGKTNPYYNNQMDNQKDNQKITPSSSSSKEKKIIKEKKIFGEFQNVLLTDAEYEKLLKLYGNDGRKDRIENLSQYIASKGRKYSNHYATILNWERKNYSKNGKSKPW